MSPQCSNQWPHTGRSDGWRRNENLICGGTKFVAYVFSAFLVLVLRCSLPTEGTLVNVEGPSQRGVRAYNDEYNYAFHPHKDDRKKFTAGNSSGELGEGRLCVPFADHRQPPHPVSFNQAEISKRTRDRLGALAERYKNDMEGNLGTGLSGYTPKVTTGIPLRGALKIPPLQAPILPPRQVSRLISRYEPGKPQEGELGKQRNEGARKRQEEEAERQQKEKERKQQEEEARKRREEEERRRQEEEEARRRQQEEAQRRQQEEARRRQEEEARRGGAETATGRSSETTRRGGT
ncbi:hypothetical protein cyc_08053 [Cyclospora cayetanensis]|uniref:Uncharacterized protein n=1 Tax=Cyclospora cayetanensis TaxID=88456 RepID=A0A1D3D7Z0_9EIME|nr:hypothetical protein cyc_08053 [Cyclospora cayetanensis]